MSSAEVLDRMQQAMTAHDLEALVACFAGDYECEMPMHPALSFVGRDNVRRTGPGCSPTCRTSRRPSCGQRTTGICCGANGR